MSIFFGIASVLTLFFFYYRTNSKFQNLILIVTSIAFLFLMNSSILLTAVFYLLLFLLTSYLLPRLSQGQQKKLLYFQILLIITFFLATRSTFKNQLIGHSYLTLMYLGLFADILWKRTTSQFNIETVSALTYFPLAPTGPIEKISKFSQQFTQPRRFKLENLQEGLFLISLGIFKIVCIAIPLKKYTQHQELLGQVVYGPYMFVYFFFAFVQLYTEFSGLIDIVQGLSLLFGIKTSTNFKQPYLAESPFEIWNRWHCTFNQWLKEYIYFPVLLKSKNISVSTAATIFAVILWHGFSLYYIYWAIYWLVIILLYIQLRPYLKKLNVNRSVILNRMTMIALMSFSTVCFMLSTYGPVSLLNRAFNYQQLAEKQSHFVFQEMFNSITTITLCILFMVFIETIQNQDRFKKRYLIIPFIIMAIIGLGQFHGTQFYYLGL